MYVVHNRIDVPADAVDGFEKAFVESMQTTLAGVPGLQRSTLLKPAASGPSATTDAPYVASMEFEVSDGHSPNSVVAAVLIGGDFVAQGELELPVQGFFVWTLAFEVKDVSLPIEVRMTLARSAIEGTFYLRKVRLSAAP